MGGRALLATAGSWFLSELLSSTKMPKTPVEFEHCKECGQPRGKRLQVFVDLNGQNSGIEFPTGTARKPVNNWDDAVKIVQKLAQPNDELPPLFHLLSG